MIRRTEWDPLFVSSCFYWVWDISKRRYNNITTIDRFFKQWSVVTIYNHWWVILHLYSRPKITEHLIFPIISPYYCCLVWYLYHRYILDYSTYAESFSSKEWELAEKWISPIMSLWKVVSTKKLATI